MELTQIKWEKIWAKISLENWWNLINADNLVKKDSKFANFAEIERWEWWVAKISASSDENHLKVNWRKIPANQSKKVEFWDTISFWENHENVFAVHEKWTEIKKEDVQSHLKKANYEISDEEFKNILQKLNLEEKIIRWLFVWLLTITIFFAWIIFYLNSQNQVVSKNIYNLMNSKDDQIQELQKLIWENPNADAEECDPTIDENCQKTENIDLFW